MEREIINKVDYLQIVAVKNNDKIKRYEISPLESDGFYRNSEDTVEHNTVYFPGSWGLEKILSDIRRVKK